MRNLFRSICKKLKHVPRYLIILSAVIILATCLRLYRLDHQGLWYDEAKIVSLAHEFSPWNMWNEEDSSKPVFTFLILRPWIKIFGLSEYAVRFPAVILGILSVLLVYYLGSLVFNRQAGLISAFLLAISPAGIYYSQQAFYSSMEIPAVLVSMFLFFKVLDRRHGLTALTVVNAVLVYAFASCFFIVLVQNFVIAIFYRQDRDFSKRWFLSQIFVVFSLIAWWFIFTRTSPLRHAFYWVDHCTVRTLFETLENFSHGVFRFALGGTGFTLDRKYLLLPRVLLFTYVFLFLLGIAGIISESRRSGVVKLTVLMWLIFPIASLFLFSKIFFPVFAYRFIIYCLPAYYLIIAYGLLRINPIRMRLGIITFITCLHFFPLRIIYEPSFTQFKKISGWREIGSEIRRKIQAGDIIVLSPLRQIVPFWYYYKPEEKTNRIVDEMAFEPKEKWETVYNDNNILIMGPELGQAGKFVEKHEKYFKQANTVWLVIAPYWPGQGNSREYFLN